MQSKTRDILHKKDGTKCSDSTGLVFQNEHFTGRNKIKCEKAVSGKTKTIKQESKKEEEEEEKYFPGKIYDEKQLEFSKSDERENCIHSSDSEKNENIDEQELFKRQCGKVNSRIWNSALYSFSSTALLFKKRKEKSCDHKTKTFSKQNLENHDIINNSNEHKSNLNRNTSGKAARGILFLNRKRKFHLNCLFGKDEKNKIKEILRKRKQTIISNTKIINPTVSQSVDNVPSPSHRSIETNTSNLTINDEIQENFNKECVCKKAFEEPKNCEKSDNEMVILYLSNKDEKKEGCCEINEENVTKNCCHNSIVVNEITDESNYAENHLPTSETDDSNVNIPSLELLKRSSSGIKNIPDARTISEIFCCSKNSPLHSLLSVLNLTLTYNETSDTRMSSGHSNLQKNKQNKNKILKNDDELSEKMKQSNDFSLQSAQTICLNGSKLAKKTNVCKEYCAETAQNLESKLQEQSQPFVSVNRNEIACNENDTEFIEYLSEEKCMHQNPSLFFTNGNFSERPETDVTIPPDRVSECQRQGKHLVLLNSNNIVKLNEYQKNNKYVEVLSDIKKEYIPVKLNNISSIRNDYIKSDEHYKNYEETGDSESEKETEDLLFSTFKKQYIPVSKTIRGSEVSSAKSNRTPFESTSKKSFGALIEKMSLRNHYFFDEYRQQNDPDISHLTVTKYGIDKNKDNESNEISDCTDDERKETISVFPDLQIDLQDSFSENDKIQHFTDVLNNNNLQKPFQRPDSLKFELNFLDTVYTRRFQEAKKLTKNRQNRDKSPLTHPRSMYSSENTQNITEKYYMCDKNESDGKLDVENCDTGKANYGTNSSQKDRSLISQTINNCQSDTNSKWSYDSYQSTSEFSSMLSKQFKRDYIPVGGKRKNLNDANEQKIKFKKTQSTKMKEQEQFNKFCLVKTPCEDQHNEHFSKNNNKNDVIVNIILSKQDENNAELKVLKEAEERLNKQSSKISVCLSEISSDEIQEEEEEENVYREAIKEKESPVHAVTEHKSEPSDTENCKLISLTSEIPDSKKALFPRIYSDFSIENKSNPATYKCLLPGQL